MRGFGLQRQRPVADQLRIAAVLLRKIGRWMPQYAKSCHVYILVQDFRLFFAMPKSLLFGIYYLYFLLSK